MYRIQKSFSLCYFSKGMKGIVIISGEEPDENTARFFSF